MSLLEIKSFVSSIKPFDCLKGGELEEVCSHLDIVYFKNNIEMYFLLNSDMSFTK